MATILFLDVEGAFPNPVTARLLYNMRMRQVLEEYVLFIGHLLTNRCTRLKFDGFTSGWVYVDNGIVQGDPLSMILYLFYNLDLLTDVGRTEMKVGYMDNVNFFAEGPTFDDAYAALGDMMMCDGGGLDWSRNHNSKFEMSKLTLVGFSRQCIQDLAHPGKMITEPRPSLSPGDTVIQPAVSHKFVRVVFDQELIWGMQAEQVVTKATKWVLATQCLARPAVGISPCQMHQLYQVVAMPSFTYAADVWFMPICRDTGEERFRGSIGMACKLLS